MIGIFLSLKARTALFHVSGWCDSMWQSTAFMLQYGQSKCVQFFLGTRREIRAMFSSVHPQWANSTELNRWETKQWPASLMHGQNVRNEMLGCSTVCALAGSTEHGMDNLYTTLWSTLKAPIQIPPPTSDCHQKCQISLSEQGCDC